MRPAALGILALLMLPDMAGATSMVFGLTGGRDIVGYDPTTGAQQIAFPTNIRFDSDLELGSNGTVFGIAGGGILGYDLATGQEIAQIAVAGGPIDTSLAISPSGLVFVLRGGGVYGFDPLTSQLSVSFSTILGADAGFAISGDTLFGAFDGSGDIVGYNIQSGQQTSGFGHPTPIAFGHDLAFGPDGFLYGLTSCGDIVAYDVTSGNEVRSINTSCAFGKDLAIDASGVAFGIKNGAVRAYDVTTGLMVAAFNSSVTQYGGVVATSSTLVPIPAAFWLLGSALGVLGWLRLKALPRSARER